MAKFTVFFKDKAIQSDLIDTGVAHIGRDETNDITVDSLAVAPAHAVVIINDQECIIKQLNDDFPLVINGEETKSCTLQDNDKITIGKHYIIFNTAESFVAEEFRQNEQDEDSFHLETEHTLPEGNLQIMNGKHIGRILPLKKVMTKLGHKGSGVIVIAKRKEGYFVSALENNASLAINKTPLGDNTVKLNNNDIIVVDNATMQFFQD